MLVILRMLACTMVVLLGLAVAGASGARADDLFTRAKAGSFEDVKFDLTNAIIERGLVIDHTGFIGQMLDRTGADVGSTKPLYRNAEYMVFCSAKLSRQMMEADPANIGFCPYVIFIYERADKPGEIVVGFREPPQRGSAESQQALAAIGTLLKEIVADAVK